MYREQRFLKQLVIVCLMICMIGIEAQQLISPTAENKNQIENKSILGHYNLNLKQLNSLKAKEIAIDVPTPIGQQKRISYIEHQLFGDNFHVHDEYGNLLPSNHTSIRYYISKDKKSYLLTDFKEYFYLVYEDNHNMYSMSQIPNKKSTLILLYESREGKDFNCGTSDYGHHDGSKRNTKSIISSSYTGNLEVKIIADHGTYQHHNNSSSAVQNHITQLFAYVIATYNVINIPLVLGSVQINTSLDGYQNISDCGTALDHLRTNLNTNFTEHLVHLLVDKSFNDCGGIAYVDELCGSQEYKVGFTAQVNDFQVNTHPVSTLIGEVMAHELGHNIGSPHTHACVWNGNNTQIDDCGNNGNNSEGAQGGCYVDGQSTPIIPNTATIMSYCNNTSGQAATFHTQVATLLQNKYGLAACNNSDLSVLINAGYQTSITLSNNTLVSYDDILVYNSGDVTLTDNFNLNFYVSTNTTFDAQDIQVFSILISPNLPSNYFYIYTGTFDFNNVVNNIPSGSYYILAQLDGDNMINESDETNNTFASASTYPIQGCTSSTYYSDADNDGYGDASQIIIACTQPNGYVSNDTDCDDTNSTVYPGSLEICDGVDNNCDGNTDETGQNIYYLDSDNDGFGNASQTTMACNVPTGYVTNALDCNDTNGSIFPGGVELCDGLDNDCDGNVDEDANIQCPDFLSNCVTNLASLNTNGSGYNYATWQASQNISSISTLNAQNSILYAAGNTIELLPGFEVTNNTIFETLMEDCSLGSN